MREVFRRVRKAASSSATVLILGESGTGKELVARAIHAQSPRAGLPFVPVNTAALAESVLESEIFGHERGAFTGAISRRTGLIESADGGSLFLDEVGDMPMHVQVKLLRVIESMEILRVGSSSPVRVDVRIIAATHKNLETLVAERLFREDLYFRLSGVQIELPPLRDRVRDLEILISEFLAGSLEAVRKGIRGVSGAVLEQFRQYAWPGNLRELRKFIDAMVVEDENGELGLDDLPAHVSRILLRNRENAGKTVPDDESEKKLYVMSLLERHRWHVTRTAAILGVNRSTLGRWLRGWDIKRS